MRAPGGAAAPPGRFSALPPGRQKSEGCKAPSLLMMLFFSSAPFPAAAEAWGAIAGAQMPGLF